MGKFSLKNLVIHNIFSVLNFRVFSGAVLEKQKKSNVKRQGFEQRSKLRQLK